MELKSRLGLSDSILQTTASILEKKSAKEDVCPHCGKKPCECDGVNESLDETADINELNVSTLQSYTDKAKAQKPAGYGKRDEYTGPRGDHGSFERSRGLLRAKNQIEDKTEIPNPKVHDLRHLSDGEVYDHTQIHDDVKDGDVMHLSGGRSAILMKAWPTMHKGTSDALHSFKPGKSFESYPRYKNSVKLANSLKEEAEFTEDELSFIEAVMSEQEQHGKAKKKGKNSEIEINPEVKEEIEDLDEGRAANPLKIALSDPSHPIHKHLPAGIDAKEAVRTFNYSPGVGHFQKNKAAIEAAHEKAGGSKAHASAPAANAGSHSTDSHEPSEDDVHPSVHHPILTVRARAAKTQHGTVLGVKEVTPLQATAVDKHYMAQHPKVRQQMGAGHLAANLQRVQRGEPLEAPAMPKHEPKPVEKEYDTRTKAERQQDRMRAVKITAARRKDDIKSAAGAFLKWKSKQEG